MMRIDADAVCDNCRARARCTLDVDMLLSRRKASPGGSMHGLPDWYWKDADGGNLYGDRNLACSEKCMSVLAKDTNLRGVWKPCAE